MVERRYGIRRCDTQIKKLAARERTPYETGNLLWLVEVSQPRINQIKNEYGRVKRNEESRVKGAMFQSLW